MGKIHVQRPRAGDDPIPPLPMSIPTIPFPVIWSNIPQNRVCVRTKPSALMTGTVGSSRTSEALMSSRSMSANHGWHRGGWARPTHHLKILQSLSPSVNTPGHGPWLESKRHGMKWYVKVTDYSTVLNPRGSQRRSRSDRNNSRCARRPERSR